MSLIQAPKLVFFSSLSRKRQKKVANFPRRHSPEAPQTLIRIKSNKVYNRPKTNAFNHESMDRFGNYECLPRKITE